MTDNIDIYLIMLNLLLWTLFVIIPLLLFFILRKRIKIKYRLFFLIIPIIILGNASFVGIRQYLFFKKTLPQRNTIQFKTDYLSIQDSIKILEKQFYPRLEITERILFAYARINNSLYIDKERIGIIDNYDSLLSRFCETKSLLMLTKSDKQRLLKIYLFLIDNGVEGCVIDNGKFIYDYKNNGLEEWEEFIRYITIDTLMEQNNSYIIHEEKGKLKLIEKI